MIALKANLDEAHLARVAGTLVVAHQENNVHKVLLTTPDDDVDLEPLIAALANAVQAADTDSTIELSSAPNLLNRPESQARVQDVDATLLVVRATHGTHDKAERAVQQLQARSKPFLGIILAESRNPVPRLIQRIFGLS